VEVVVEVEVVVMVVIRSSIAVSIDSFRRQLKTTHTVQCDANNVRLYALKAS